MPPTKETTQGIVTAFSILFFYKIWRNVTWAINLKKPEDDSDPDIDFLMVWNEIELSSSQKQDLWDMIGDEERLRGLGANTSEELTSSIIRRYVMRRVATRDLTFSVMKGKHDHYSCMTYVIRYRRLKR
jgi:hypothetical protein